MIAFKKQKIMLFDPRKLQLDTISVANIFSQSFFEQRSHTSKDFHGITDISYFLEVSVNESMASGCFISQGKKALNVV